MGPGCWWGQGSFFGLPLNMITGLLFWSLVVFGVFAVISRFVKRAPASAGSQETPIEILRKRYARGEIDPEEFSRRKKDLEG